MIKFSDSHQSSLPPSEQRLGNSCEHVPQGKAMGRVSWRGHRDELHARHLGAPRAAAAGACGKCRRLALPPQITQSLHFYSLQVTDAQGMLKGDALRTLLVRITISFLPINSFILKTFVRNL